MPPAITSKISATPNNVGTIEKCKNQWKRIGITNAAIPIIADKITGILCFTIIISLSHSKLGNFLFKEIPITVIKME